MSTRVLLLLCMMGMGYLLLLVSMFVVMLLSGGHFGDRNSILLMLALQGPMVFILPAVLAMALFYRRPLHVMQLDRAPSLKALAVVVVFYVVSIPAMNWLTDLNASMNLPSWMDGIERYMRSAEDKAALTTEQLLDIRTVGRLIVSVLVIGAMAGLGEEFFFRGAMLRTMQDSRLNVHAVVWIVAAVFSAFHLQFYGFLPRLVLGAWLGYLFVWTRSLWVPVIAHTLNNSTVVVMSYLANKGVVSKGLGDNLGLPADGAFPWMAMVSLVLSIALAVWAARILKKNRACVSGNIDKGATA